MTEFSFQQDFDNSSLDKNQIYLDDSNILRFTQRALSSSNFDGSIGLVFGDLSASFIQPGMSILLSSSAAVENYKQVLKVIKGDGDLEGEESASVSIGYLDEYNNLQFQTFAYDEQIYAYYEDWDNKEMGNFGWTLTHNGNAMFSNVAVRGEIEATSGAISGDLTLGGSLTASSETGYLIISASGINAATASGSLNFNNETGEFSISGNITAKSGVIEEMTVGGLNYEIINIIGVETPPSSQNSGQFILTTTSEEKLLYKGIVVEFFGTTASGTIYLDGNPESPSLVQSGKLQVLTASYNETGIDFPLINKYHCFIPQSGVTFNIDLKDFSASGGSYTFGPMEFGIIKPYSLAPNQPGNAGSPLPFETNEVVVEGFIFNTVGLGDFWQDYIPDYLDVSGRFKLGRGKIFFDGNDLFIEGSVNATSGSFSGTITASFGRIAGWTLGDVSGIGAIKSAGDRVVLRGDGTIILSGTTGDPLYLTGAIPGWRIFSGTNGPTARFSVDEFGGLKAVSASIIGGLYGASVSGGIITGGTINSSVLNSATGNFTGTVNATSGSFTGGLYGASVSGGIISSGSFVGGILQSLNYSGVTDGSAFSTTGTHFNLNIGTITAKQFRVDTSGNAFFAGSLSSGVSISAPVISGGSISGNSISGGSITGTNIFGTFIKGGYIYGASVSGGTITGNNFRTSDFGDRIEILAADGTSDRILFYSDSGENYPAYLQVFSSDPLFFRELQIVGADMSGETSVIGGTPVSWPVQAPPRIRMGTGIGTTNANKSRLIIEAETIAFRGLSGTASYADVEFNIPIASTLPTYVMGGNGFNGVEWIPISLLPSGTSGVTNFPAITASGLLINPNHVNVVSGEYRVQGNTVIDSSRNAYFTSVRGENGHEMSQVIVSSNSPTLPGNYRAGTLWAVI